MSASTATALPRVNGQHRNHALAAARRTRAVELAAEGLTYQEIAEQLGYRNRGTVHRMVQETLNSQTTESVEMLRRLEADRLDALQLAVWDKAINGDLAAARQALRIIQQRSRLMGLDQVSAESGHARPRTVVVPPEEPA